MAVTSAALTVVAAAKCNRTQPIRHDADNSNSDAAISLDDETGLDIKTAIPSLKNRK
jgi:hypothetical protein